MTYLKMVAMKIAYEDRVSFTYNSPTAKVDLRRAYFGFPVDCPSS